MSNEVVALIGALSGLFAIWGDRRLRTAKAQSAESEARVDESALRDHLYDELQRLIGVVSDLQHAHGNCEQKVLLLESELARMKATMEHMQRQLDECAKARAR